MKQWFLEMRHSRNKERWISQFIRLIYYRLVVPLKRRSDDPKPIARGVMVGVAVGLTPAVGVQLMVVFVIWLFCRKIVRWDFNVAMAMAWTWLSNPFDMIPLYYMFAVTGKAMLGGTTSLVGFGEFASQMNEVLSSMEGNGYEQMKIFFTLIKDNYLVYLLVGWIPYSLVFSVVGYRYAYRLVFYAQEKKRARRLLKITPQKNQTD